MKDIKSAGGIVINSNNKLILVSNKGISWSFPKGHIEEGEDALTAAKREIYEESGVSDLILIKKLRSFSRKKNVLEKGKECEKIKNITMFLFKTTQLRLKPIDPKNPEAIWVDFESALKLLKYKEDKDFLKAIINKITF